MGVFLVDSKFRTKLIKTFKLLTHFSIFVYLLHNGVSRLGRPFSGGYHLCLDGVILFHTQNIERNKNDEELDVVQNTGFHLSIPFELYLTWN